MQFHAKIMPAMFLKTQSRHFSVNYSCTYGVNEDVSLDFCNISFILWRMLFRFPVSATSWRAERLQIISYLHTEHLIITLPSYFHDRISLKSFIWRKTFPYAKSVRTTWKYLHGILNLGYRLSYHLDNTLVPQSNEIRTTSMSVNSVPSLYHPGFLHRHIPIEFQMIWSKYKWNIVRKGKFRNVTRYNRFIQSWNKYLNGPILHDTL